MVDPFSKRITFLKGPPSEWLGMHNQCNLVNPAYLRRGLLGEQLGSFTCYPHVINRVTGAFSNIIYLKIKWLKLIPSPDQMYKMATDNRNQWWTSFLISTYSPALSESNNRPKIKVFEHTEDASMKFRSIPQSAFAQAT